MLLGQLVLSGISPPSAPGVGGRTRGWGSMLDAAILVIGNWDHLLRPIKIGDLLDVEVPSSLPCLP